MNELSAIMNEAAFTRVAAVTIESVMAEPATNLDKIERWAEEARSGGATFAVFPEECVTGSLNKARMTRQQAAPIVDAADRIAVPRLESLSRRLDMTLIVGTIAPVSGHSDRFANAALVIGPQGHLATYRKIHLPNPGEREWFEAGDRALIVSSQGWTFSVGICADLNYPELFRAAALHGAEFFALCVGNNGNGTLECGTDAMLGYSRLMFTSAVANGLYIFYSDQAGPRASNLAFCQDLRGEVVSSCLGKEGVAFHEVSRDSIRKARAGGDPTNVLSLRPDAYANPLVVSP